MEEMHSSLIGRLEVSTVGPIKDLVFRNMTSCRVVHRYQRFGGVFCLQVQCTNLKMEVVSPIIKREADSFSETLILHHGPDVPFTRHHSITL